MSNILTIKTPLGLSRADLEAAIAAHSITPHASRINQQFRYQELDTRSWDILGTPATPKGFCFDGTYLYATTYQGVFCFIRINPATGQQVDLSVYVPEGNLMNPIWDGTYIWLVPEASGQTVRLYRFDPRTNGVCSFLSIVEAYAPAVLELQVGNLWIGCNNGPGTYLKFDMATEVFTEYNVVDANAKIRALTFDGTHIWIGYEEPLERISKMDPTDGTFVDYALDGGDAGSERVVFDGTWIWTASDTDPTRVKRVDPTDGSHTTITLAAGNKSVRSMLYDGKSIWIGQKPQDYALVQLNPTDNSYRVWGLGVGEERCYALGHDGLHVWAALDGSTKKFLRCTKAR